jgi:hypothetical protein
MTNLEQLLALVESRCDQNEAELRDWFAEHERCCVPHIAGTLAAAARATPAVPDAAAWALAALDHRDAAAVAAITLATLGRLSAARLREKLKKGEE